jgi:hypothetical protein
MSILLATIWPLECHMDVIGGPPMERMEPAGTVLV